ncbi:hypothetical protein D3C77_517920 [compost metagenome]
MKTSPATNTAASACCQVSPNENTSVNTKNALSPIPGTRIRGELAHSAISIQPMKEQMTVTIVAASYGIPTMLRMAPFTAMI